MWVSLVLEVQRSEGLHSICSIAFQMNLLSTSRTTSSLCAGFTCRVYLYPKHGFYFRVGFHWSMVSNLHSRLTWFWSMAVHVQSTPPSQAKRHISFHGLFDLKHGIPCQAWFHIKLIITYIFRIWINLEHGFCIGSYSVSNQACMWVHLEFQHSFTIPHEPPNESCSFRLSNPQRKKRLCACEPSVDREKAISDAF